MSGGTQRSIVSFKTGVIPGIGSGTNEFITRPSNTTQYTGGDAISDTNSDEYFTFNMAHLTAGEKQTGVITSALMTSSVKASTLPDFELWLFHASIAEIVDNAAFTVSDAEILTLVGIIEFPQSQFRTSALNAACEVRNLGLAYRTAGANSGGLDNNTLIGQLVDRGGYTPASAEVFSVHLGISRD